MPVKVLSITNGQQLLVELEEHGRAVRLACLQAPRFRQEPWAEFAQSVLESHVIRGDQAKFELRSRDVYGRLVGRLFVNGKDLGAQLVRQASVVAWDGFGVFVMILIIQNSRRWRRMRVLVFGRYHHHWSVLGTVSYTHLTLPTILLV